MGISILRQPFLQSHSDAIWRQQMAFINQIQSRIKTGFYVWMRIRRRWASLRVYIDIMENKKSE